MDQTLYAELGKQAIFGGAGISVRNEPDYELLEAEMAKMSNPSSSATLDWNIVEQLAAGLLATKGKDMLVASYLAGALMQTRGLEGLADGVQVLADMMHAFWDTLQPPLARVRGRRNAMQWLIDRVQANAAEHDWSTLPPQEPELVARLRASLGAIDALTGEKDPDAPSMRSLSQLLGQLVLREVIVAPEPEPERAVAAAPAAVAAAGAPSLPAPPALLAGADLGQASDDACARLSSIADLLLQADLANPGAYRLARIGAWAALEQLPPNDGGATRIPAPMSQVSDVFARLNASQADEDIVRFAEAQLPAYPFWLDLHRACAQALARLGAAYGPARDEVNGETGRLVARLAGLEQLRFDGGMPFADDETVAWLDTLGTPSGAAGALPAAGQEAQAGIAAARMLAADGSLVEAAALLQRLLSQPLAPAAKLLVRIRLAELLDAERPQAQLQAFGQSIVDEIDRHQLAIWDAPLALQGLQVAYRIAARDTEAPHKAEALLLRIVALDVKVAVSLVT